MVYIKKILIVLGFMFFLSNIVNAQEECTNDLSGFFDPSGVTGGITIRVEETEEGIFTQLTEAASSFEIKTGNSHFDALSEKYKVFFLGFIPEIPGFFTMFFEANANINEVIKDYCGVEGIVKIFSADDVPITSTAIHKSTWSLIKIKTKGN